jgi:hypothetical protein
MTGLVIPSWAIAPWTVWRTPRTNSSSRGRATAPSSLPNTARPKISHDAVHRHVHA